MPVSSGEFMASVFTGNYLLVPARFRQTQPLSVESGFPQFYFPVMNLNMIYLTIAFTKAVLS